MDFDDKRVPTAGWRPGLAIAYSPEISDQHNNLARHHSWIEMRMERPKASGRERLLLNTILLRSNQIIHEIRRTTESKAPLWGFTICLRAPDSAWGRTCYQTHGYNRWVQTSLLNTKPRRRWSMDSTHCERAEGTWSVIGKPTDADGDIETSNNDLAKPARRNLNSATAS
jgi:hypothetical protein